MKTRNKENGISLLALIITIIVIIILAAVVVGTSLNTPEQAMYAKFTSDMSTMSEAVQNAYMDKYSELAISNSIVEDDKIYNWVATGVLETPVEQDILITAGNKLNMATLPQYNNKEWKIASSTGEVKLLPGYVYKNNVYSTVADIRNGGTPVEGGGETPVGPTTPTEPEGPAEPTDPAMPAGEVEGYSEAGTVSDPYQIWSAEDFIHFMNETTNASSKYYKMMRNIDLSNADSYISSSNMTQNIPMRADFLGNFNGNGKTIKNMTINTTGNYVGMFKATRASAVVENLTLDNCNITGSQSVGAITGDNYGTIRNCVIRGTVTGAQAVGGIAGFSQTGAKIENCVNEATVVGSSSEYGAGGIVGDNRASMITCINKGNISGAKYVGGITGKNGGATAVITNSSNGGSITGKEYIGGITGYLNLNGKVLASFNTGSVTATTQLAGGIVGRMDGNAFEVNNTYNVGAITGPKYIGGIAGYYTQGGNGLLKNSYSVGTLPGSDSNIGGIAGVAYANIIQNTYYKTGTAAKGFSNVNDVVGVTEAKSESDMKTSSFVTSLNGSQIPAPWKADANGGYPILSWQ